MKKNQKQLLSLEQLNDTGLYPLIDEYGDVHIYVEIKGEMKEIHPEKSTRPHKNSRGKTYLIVRWPGHQMGYHRVIYFLYHPDEVLQPGMDVSHIDDNAFNNDPNNLEILPHGENIRKRKHNGANQYINSVRRTEEKWKK